jgi:hypothetical protein
MIRHTTTYPSTSSNEPFIYLCIEHTISDMKMLIHCLSLINYHVDGHYTVENLGNGKYYFHVHLKKIDNYEI